MPTFQEFNNEIQGYLKDHKDKRYSLDDKDHKLPLTDSVFCAEDSLRNKSFRYAIESRIQGLKQSEEEKIVIVDAGSWIGILWLFALILGADICYFIEENPFTMEFCKKFIEDFWLKNKSIFLNKDATQTVIPEQYNLLISETLTSGFVDEDFLSIIQNLRQFASKNSYIIPQSFFIQIDELNEKQKVVATQNIQINSQQLKEKKLLFLRHPETKTLRFHTDAYLSEKIKIKANSCMAVLNDRIFSVDQDHQFFDIITKN